MTGGGDTPRPEADGVILSVPAVWGRRTMTAVERAPPSGSVTISLPQQVVAGQGIAPLHPSDDGTALRPPERLQPTGKKSACRCLPSPFASREERPTHSIPACRQR